MRISRFFKFSQKTMKQCKTKFPDVCPNSKTKLDKNNTSFIDENIIIKY